MPSELPPRTESGALLLDDSEEESVSAADSGWQAAIEAVLRLPVFEWDANAAVTEQEEEAILLGIGLRGSVGACSEEDCEDGLELLPPLRARSPDGDSHSTATAVLERALCGAASESGASPRRRPAPLSALDAQISEITPRGPARSCSCSCSSGSPARHDDGRRLPSHRLSDSLLSRGASTVITVGTLWSTAGGGGSATFSSPLSGRRDTPSVAAEDVCAAALAAAQAQSPTGCPGPAAERGSRPVTPGAGSARQLLGQFLRNSSPRHPRSPLGDSMRASGGLHRREQGSPSHPRSPLGPSAQPSAGLHWRTSSGLRSPLGDSVHPSIGLPWLAPMLVEDLEVASVHSPASGLESNLDYTSSVYELNETGEVGSMVGETVDLDLLQLVSVTALVTLGRSSPVPVTLSEEQASALPKVRFENPERQRCSICLEQFGHGMLLTGLGCGHAFHVDCLAQWVQRGAARCPNCRADIAPTSPR